ncbi:MAG TPA: arginine deiminase family protein [Steroidobacteraceae bacterium]|jgi:N-dimethylarginine dimethylaminohydrolase
MSTTLTPGAAAPWLDSEYGTLMEVLLCRPSYYNWSPSNTIVLSSIRSGMTADRDAACRQHQQLVTALEEIGVTCRYLVEDPVLRYQTYTRDSGVMTPWGLLVCQLARPERRGEWASVLDFTQLANIPVWKAVTAGSLEGGDVQVLRPGELVIGVNEVRTQKAAAEQVARWFAEEGWSTRFVHVPEHFLHLDVLFTALDAERALCAVDLIDSDDLAWFEARFELIPLGYKDVMRMGTNVVALGNKRILSSQQHETLNRQLEKLGYDVRRPDLEQFVIEGGAAHCLTMPLRRIPTGIQAASGVLAN